MYIERERISIPFPHLDSAPPVQYHSVLMSSADQSASALRAQQVRVVAKLSFIDLPPECQEIAFQHLADTYQEKPLASWDKQASFPARSRMFLYPAMAWYDREVRTSKAKELE